MVALIVEFQYILFGSNSSNKKRGGESSNINTNGTFWYFIVVLLRYLLLEHISDIFTIFNLLIP